MRRYEHVIIVGVDGGGHFIKEGDTPEFDRIFQKGAVTYEALTSYPSISAECWSSMVTGVSPYLHKRTNDILSQETYPKDFPFETCYRTIRREYPQAVLGAYCDWSPLIHGLVEEELKVDCLSLPDRELVKPACEYIREKKPDFLFIHTDSVDHEGHGNGYGMPAYMKQIHTVDGYIGEIYQAIREAGMLDTTLFCVVCDHGGTVDLRPDGSGYKGSHGGWTYNERTITFAAAGPGICQGEIGPMNIRDIAAIIRYAFGIPVPEFDLAGWTAQIPNHLFEGVEPIYQDISDEINAAPRISAAQHQTALKK